MIRNLTPEEQAELHHHCIFCKQNLFYEGPQGGLSFNVYCALCYAGYNITHEQLPWQLIAEPGEKTVAELAPILRECVTMPGFVEQLSATIEHAMHTVRDKYFPPK